MSSRRCLIVKFVFSKTFLGMFSGCQRIKFTPVRGAALDIYQHPWRCTGYLPASVTSDISQHPWRWISTGIRGAGYLPASVTSSSFFWHIKYRCAVPHPVSHNYVSCEIVIPHSLAKPNHYPLFTRKATVALPHLCANCTLPMSHFEKALIRIRSSGTFLRRIQSCM